MGIFAAKVILRQITEKMPFAKAPTMPAKFIRYTRRKLAEY
jgi:hypothetical protein